MPAKIRASATRRIHTPSSTASMGIIVARRNAARPCPPDALNSGPAPLQTAHSLATRPPTPKEPSVAKPIVLIAEQLSPATVEALGPDFDVRDVDGTDRAALLAALPEASAVLIRSATQIDAEAIGVAKNLKVVARAGVGLDNVDLPAATVRRRHGRERSDLEHHQRRRAHHRPHPEPRPPHPGRARQPRRGGVEAQQVHRHRAVREDGRHHRPRPHRRAHRGAPAGVRRRHRRLRPLRDRRARAAARRTPAAARQAARHHRTSSPSTCRRRRRRPA